MERCNTGYPPIRASGPIFPTSLDKSNLCGPSGGLLYHGPKLPLIREDLKKNLVLSHWRHVKTVKTNFKPKPPWALCWSLQTFFSRKKIFFLEECLKDNKK